MSKSVLIIDTPADCRDCTVRSLADDCLATGRYVKGYRVNKNDMQKAVKCSCSVCLVQ